MKRLLVIALLASGCAELKDLVQKPTLHVEGAHVASLSLDEVNLLVDLGIDNPNSFGLAVAGIDFALSVDGRPFLDGKTTSGIKIAAASKSTVPVAVGVPVPKILKTLTNLPDANEVPYKIEGNITLNAKALGDVRLPFAHEGRLPIPHLPKLSIGGLRVEKLSLRSAQIKLDLGVKNPNAFPVTRLGGTLKLSLSGTEVGDVDASLAGAIEAGKEGTATLGTEIKILALLPKFAEKEIDVKLAGELAAATPFGPMKIPVTLEKKVSIRK